MRFFGKYGFFRHTLPVWARASAFRLRHGFDYRDCWNLDAALAKWLAPRLKHMSEVTHGAPCGYPDKTPALDAETDFRAWQNDLLCASVAFERYANVDYMEDWSLEREDEIRKDAMDAMAWLAKHFTGLWD